MATGDKPLAIVLACHNGSGKSTLWYDKLADQLKIPLINADRLTLSILPHPIDAKQTLRPWAGKATRQRRTVAETLPGGGPALHGTDHGSAHALCLRDGVFLPREAESSARSIEFVRHPIAMNCKFAIDVEINFYNFID
jgi:hypothetical protein